VVFGYGPVGGSGRLNVYARREALAAGTLLESGAAKRLLIPGGRTGDDALPSEAALMALSVARHVPVSPVVMLEERAADTLDNVVLSANLLDAERGGGSCADERLGFLALRMHGPRVRYLAELVGLEGAFIALEPVVAARSARHRRLLERLTKTPSYARLAASQVRAMRGLAELPGFWLPPLGRLENPDRLRHVQQHPTVASLNLPTNPDAFKDALLIYLGVTRSLTRTTCRSGSRPRVAEADPRRSRARARRGRGAHRRGAGRTRLIVCLRARLLSPGRGWRWTWPRCGLLQKKRGAARVVVGLPSRLRGGDSPQTTKVRAFAAALQKAGLTVVFEDERLTTRLAAQGLAQSGLKRKQRQEKGLLDERAAVLILESYLAKQRPA
jgi:putative Holliday junction resolvase